MACCNDKNTNAAPINRTAEERDAIWSICRACELRVQAFGGNWCGKPWIVDPSTVIEKAKQIITSSLGIVAVPGRKGKVKGCGCNIRHKLQYANAACPLGKWQ